MPMRPMHFPFPPQQPAGPAAPALPPPRSHSDLVEDFKDLLLEQGVSTSCLHTDCWHLIPWYRCVAHILTKSSKPAPGLVPRQGKINGSTLHESAMDAHLFQ